jgi:hypothetical protein
VIDADRAEFGHAPHGPEVLVAEPGAVALDADDPPVRVRDEGQERRGPVGVVNPPALESLRIDARRLQPGDDPGRGLGGEFRRLQGCLLRLDDAADDRRLVGMKGRIDVGSGGAADRGEPARGQGDDGPTTRPGRAWPVT